MKKICILLASIGLTSTANAQIAMTMDAQNGQMSMIVRTSMTGLTPGYTMKKVVRVSNNPSFTTIIGGAIDTFKSIMPGETKIDTLKASVHYPALYYVLDSVYQTDLIGKVTVVHAINTTGIILTPAFVAPTQKIRDQKSDSLNAYLEGHFSSGYDSATIKVIVSYGDTTFSSPSVLFPAVEMKIGPILNTTVQTVVLPITIPIGVVNLPYSYRVYITNSKKTEVSQTYTGKTRSASAVGINDPFAPEPLCAANVQVVSMTGQVVYKGKVDNLADTRKITKSISVPGIYIIQAMTENGIQLPPQKISIN